MAVYARSDKEPTSAANDLVDLRTDPSVRAGSFCWDGLDIASGWHRDLYHQVEYALEGVAEVETPAGRYLLPPHQAIWIPAGLPHRTLHGVRSVAVFFDLTMLPAPDDRARVLAAAPVIREMMIYARRWPITRSEADSAADAFFDALAFVVVDWLRHEAPLCLPTTSDAIVSAVMAYTDEHLASVTSASVCQALGLSERTLRRRFIDVTGITWREYLGRSRLLRAMALLADANRSVTDVAASVGFESSSAFTRAFRTTTGESPSAYRRRVRSAD
jgi:AraC-like DNA-binding protein